MKIGAVILDYHVPVALEGCVDALLAQTWKDLSIVVVDRDTTSESRKRLQERYGKLSYVSIVPIVERLNFTRGINVGIRYAHEKLGCDLVLVVDCGARLEPDVVEQVAGMDLAGVGVVSPSVYARDGYPQRPHYESARRGHLVRRIAELPQAFVTTTALEDLDAELRAHATAWEVGGEPGGATIREVPGKGPGDAAAPAAGAEADVAPHAGVGAAGARHAGVRDSGVPA